MPLSEEEKKRDNCQVEVMSSPSPGKIGEGLQHLILSLKDTAIFGGPLACLPRLPVSLLWRDCFSNHPPTSPSVASPRRHSSRLSVNIHCTVIEETHGF